MPPVVVTPTPLVSGVESADILDAGGVSIVDSVANWWVITPAANTSLPLSLIHI